MNKNLEAILKAAALTAAVAFVPACDDDEDSDKNDGNESSTNDAGCPGTTDAGCPGTGG